MDANARKRSSRAFCDSWRGRGYEKGDAQVFWTELLQQVVGMRDVSRHVRFELRTSAGGFIDAIIPDAGVIVEQKGLGVDLDKPEERQGRMVTPFEQALAYAESFPRNRQPRFVVVCNFGEFRVHDRDACARSELASRYVSFTLDELGERPHLLDFIVDPANSRAEKERRVSMEAGRLIGRLHAMLRERYLDPDSEQSSHALNVLCVRLVFCLFCEDADLFPKDALLNYLRDVEPENMRLALKRLFRALDTPLDQRDPYDGSLKPFPYVNGGLFTGDAEIPNFTPEIKHELLYEVSQQTDWSAISPTIFGGIFEGTLNPETRRSGGMHYTSPENIHKVIDPLFLDDLKAELDGIRVAPGQTPRKRKNALRRFRAKLARLTFLDPACGSGNFLTETYLSLRKLEDDVLADLNDGQTEMVLDGGAADSERVTLSQFYGIEINDFAVRVARTALWIAQLQANAETDMLLDAGADDFPLRDSANIVEGNALRMDWNDVLPASACRYVMGNPPFNGASMCSASQKSEIVSLFDGVRLAASLDYVSGWYYKAACYIADVPTARCAFVSTNSITQGEQVYPIWHTLAKRFNIEIDFAYRTFVWNSEALDQAHVHCVIVGFSHGIHPKTLFDASQSSKKICASINPYLLDAPNVVVKSSSAPIRGDRPIMKRGSYPVDGGWYLFTKESMEEFLQKEPRSARFFRPWVGSTEFINGKERWCLYLGDATSADIVDMPLVVDRVNKVRQVRLGQGPDSRGKTAKKTPPAATVKAADSPMRFFTDNVQSDPYLIVPKVSSERRRYVPIGFLQPVAIASEGVSVVGHASLFDFGLLASQTHNAWMRVVGGRLKSDYRYTPGLVYNTFPWPDADDHARFEVVACAQRVLDARDLYAGISLAKMYGADMDSLFPELARAHRELDAAVEAAYGVCFHGDEERIVAHLFKLYANLTAE